MEKAMPENLSRRDMIVRSGICLGAAAGSVTAGAAPTPRKPGKQDAYPTPGKQDAYPTSVPDKPFRYCLNTGTIMGHKLPIDREIEVAAAAGYDGIEPWLGNIRRYIESGGSTADLKKRLDDRALVVESAIGFPRWAVDDDTQRAEGLEAMRRDMDVIAQLGGTHIAAPPAGINRVAGMDLRKIAQRYRAVLELGQKSGVVPQLEIWGSAQTLGTAAEAAFVAVAADHDDACLLLDAYHLYKGGSDFRGLKLLNGAAMHCFHINDYPADPPRETIADADRVYPGDGVAPLETILRDLIATGFRGALSLELFNRTYWKQDVAVVAQTGLEKTKAAVRSALATA